MPNVDDIRKQLMIEAYATPYSMHPGSTKMYYNLKKSFWWHGMKRCSGICTNMFDFLLSQGRAPETRKRTSANPDPRMEVGRYFYGFHYKTTSDSQWL